MVNEAAIRDAMFRLQDRKGYWADVNEHMIFAPMEKGITEEILMQKSMLGSYFKEAGFTVTFEKKDVEYMTKGSWRNYRGWDREEGHKAYLRNRLCMILTW